MGVDLAVVTGGAGGLGRFITQRLAERRLCVVIADTDHAAATQLVTELQHRGHRAVFVDTDAADAEAVERLMTQAADLGTLRVLVNNAGGWLPGPQYPEGREWRRSVDLNLIMPMLAAQLTVPMMINSGGSIVNVSSSGGMGSRAYSSPEYGAAKAGLIRFTSCVANWADSHRIRVNCVVPHWIGLDRARHEFEQLTDQEKQGSGGLVEPDLSPTLSSPSPWTVNRRAASSSSVRTGNPTMSTPEAPIRMSTGWPGERSMSVTRCRGNASRARSPSERLRSATT